MEQEQPIAVWTFDENFKDPRKVQVAIHNGVDDPETIRLGPMLVRSGFEETLDDLSQNHLFTNYAFSDYYGYVRDEAVRLTGLDSRLKEIASKEEWNKNHGWPYRYFMDKLGLSDTEATKRMIVMGTEGYHQPFDVPGLVFLKLNAFDHSYTQDVSILGLIAVHLWEKGGGDFKRGFDRIYDGAKEGTLPGDPFPIRSTEIPGDIKFIIQYYPCFNEDTYSIPERSTPMIYYPTGPQPDRQPRLVTGEIRSLSKF